MKIYLKSERRIAYNPIYQIISILLALTILSTSCASTTIIQTTPTGAKLYLNGEQVGNTPYTHRDSKIVGTSTPVKIEKEGFEVLNTSFSRDEEVDVGAIIGGIFFIFPFLWTMKYKPVHNYILVPMNYVPQSESKINLENLSKTKVDKLKELKQLLDEKLITTEEYEKERKRIIEG